MPNKGKARKKRPLNSQPNENINVISTELAGYHEYKYKDEQTGEWSWVESGVQICHLLNRKHAIMENGKQPKSVWRKCTADLLKRKEKKNLNITGFKEYKYSNQADSKWVSPGYPLIHYPNRTHFIISNGQTIRVWTKNAVNSKKSRSRQKQASKVKDNLKKSKFINETIKSADSIPSRSLRSNTYQPLSRKFNQPKPLTAETHLFSNRNRAVQTRPDPKNLISAEALSSKEESKEKIPLVNKQECRLHQSQLITSNPFMLFNDSPNAYLATPINEGEDLNTIFLDIIHKL